MIKGISSTGRYTMVTGGTANNPYISPGSAGAGMMRWNPNMNCMEINDGNMWKMLETSYASVGLTGEAESLLDWAREERNKQLEWERLASNNKGVKLALENLNKAQEQLKIMAHLAKEDYDTTS